MGRATLTLPDRWPFETDINVRVTDLNYGNHVGNDTVLGLLHEARVRLLGHFGWSEKDAGGCGLIMVDAVVLFKRQIHYPGVLTAQVAWGDMSRVGFAVYYRLWTTEGQGSVVVVEARTAMAFFDYDRGRPARMPLNVQQVLAGATAE